MNLSNLSVLIILIIAIIWITRDVHTESSFQNSETSGIDIIKSQSTERQWSDLTKTDFPLFNKKRLIPDDIAFDEYNGSEKISPVYQMTEKTSRLPKLNNKKVDKRQLISQEFDCPSRDYILTYRNTQPYVPMCDINKIREERKKNIKNNVDLSGINSLRDDYEYLG